MQAERRVERERQRSAEEGGGLCVRVVVVVGVGGLVGKGDEAMAAIVKMEAG